jgi:hypothetical protein
MLKIIGTRRLNYQIKSILLIDWVYRYSILMGDRFCNIRNPEGKALSAHKSSINSFGFSEQCNATVNIDTLQNIPSAVPVSPFPLRPHLNSSSMLHTLCLIDSHLNGLCPSPRREYHIIQYILKGKQECSCKHALADFWSNSYISHIS